MERKDECPGGIPQKSDKKEKEKKKVLSLLRVLVFLLGLLPGMAKAPENTLNFSTNLNTEYSTTSGSPFRLTVTVGSYTPAGGDPTPLPAGTAIKYHWNKSSTKCRSKERDRASADDFAATCGWTSRCTAAQSTPCICGASPCPWGQTQGNNLPTRRSTAGRPFCSARSGRRKRRSGAFSGRRLPGPRPGSKRNNQANPKQQC